MANAGFTVNDLEKTVRSVLREELRTVVLEIMETEGRIKREVKGYIDQTRKELKLDMERMEGRVTVGMGLLQRDGFARLDAHEAQIVGLKKLNQESI